MTETPSKYSNAILAKHPNAQNLRAPEIQGSQNNVLFADINNKTFVFKFNTLEQIQKNIYVSNIYKTHHIPCPNIKFGEHNGIFFEEYESLPGIPFYKAIANGMPECKIKQVYDEILYHIKTMRQITIPQTLCFRNLHAHQFAKEHTTNVNNALIGQICMALVYSVNVGPKSDISLYHSDITPKNTIVSPDGHLVGFIDIDSVVISNINYIFGMMCANYIQHGYDINELITKYQKISGQKINRHRVRTIADTVAFGKKLLWQHAHKKNK